MALLMLRLLLLSIILLLIDLYTVDHLELHLLEGTNVSVNVKLTRVNADFFIQVVRIVVTFKTFRISTAVTNAWITTGFEESDSFDEVITCILVVVQKGVERFIVGVLWGSKVVQEEKGDELAKLGVW